MNFEVWADGRLRLKSGDVRCALGRGAVVDAAAKREGDGATPAGLWPLRRVLYRPDRRPPPITALPARPIREGDGWCDAPDDPAYNRPIVMPYPASAEALWREDGVYDLIVILGHNDDPPVAGAGSAIFLHLARPDYAPTEGCVALGLGDMLAFLREGEPGDGLWVRL